MEELTRTRAGQFTLETSLTLSEIALRKQEGRLMDAVIPVDAVFEDYPRLTVRKDWEKTAKNGNPLPGKAFAGMDGADHCRGNVRIYDESGQFLSVSRWREERDEYHIIKMFYVPQ